MNTRNNAVKRTLALVLLLTMILSLVVGAVAARAEEDPGVAPEYVGTGDELINKDKLGSITVTKYANTNSNAATGDATGTNGDEPDTSAIGTNEAKPDAGYQPLEGAKFVLVKIYGKDFVVDYYDGLTVTSPVLETEKLTDVSVDGDSSSYTVKYNDEEIANGNDSTNIWVGVTDANGKYAFNSLPVGIYVLREIDAHGLIDSMSDDAIISIPMVNTQYDPNGSSNNDNAEWIYDINVYPKNHELTGTFELTKKGHTESGESDLAGVHFKLEKKEFDANGNLPEGNWTAVTAGDAGDGSATNPYVLVTGNDGKITFTGLTAGRYGTQYKLTEYYCDGTGDCTTASPAGYIIDERPLYFQVTKDTMVWNLSTNDENQCNNENTSYKDPNITVTNTADHAGPKIDVVLHNELPTLTKQVNDSVNANGVAAGWTKYGDFGADETIKYKLTVYVPENVTDLDNFTIVDTLPEGLTIDMDSIEVSDVTDFEAEINAENAVTYDFTDDTLAAVAGETITITYNVRMNDDTVFAGNGNKNTAVLTYSASIKEDDTEPSDYTITDEAVVYTYAFQITKHKDTATGEAMKDIEFQLLGSDKSTVLSVVKESDGVYRLCKSDDTGKVTTLVTNSTGVIQIKGLDPDTYYLKETKTADGYNLLSGLVKFVVEPGRTTDFYGDVVEETPVWNDSKTELTVGEYKSTAYNGTNYNSDNTDIVNKQGFVLPQTGSMGYLLFCAAGLVLVVGGTALLLSSRKKRIH